MAILRSDLITNENNKVLNSKGLRGKVIGQVAEYNFTGGIIANNDVILMMRIPVDAIITSVRLFSSDWGTTGLANVGFYKANGSTIASDADAVDEDAIGTIIDVKTAAVSNSEIRFETLAATSVNLKAWELAGLSDRPNYDEFYLAITAGEASDATSGHIALVVQHIEV